MNTLSDRKFEMVAMLARYGITVVVLFIAIGASRASAQIQTYTPPEATAEGTDWTERIVEILPPGVESRAEARSRNTLVRDYVVTDPLYLAEPYRGRDVAGLGAVAYQPFDCVDLSGENNRRSY